MAKRENWVRLEVAPFCIEVFRNAGNLAEWTKSLAECLAYNDPSKNEFGARLLGEADAFREKKKNAADKRWEKRGYAMDMQTDAMDMQTDAMDMQTDAMDMQTDAMDMQTDAMNMQTDANTSNDVMSCTVMSYSNSSSLNQNPNTERDTREEGAHHEQQQRTDRHPDDTQGSEQPGSRGNVQIGGEPQAHRAVGAGPEVPRSQDRRAGAYDPHPTQLATSEVQRSAAGLQAYHDHTAQGWEGLVDDTVFTGWLPPSFVGNGSGRPVVHSPVAKGAKAGEGAERPLLALVCSDPSKDSREPEIAATRPQPAGKKPILLHDVPDAVKVWKAMPSKSRERSSTEEWLKAWTDSRKKGLPPLEDMLAAVDAWKRSGKWAEDGGRWQEAAHRWLARRQWENIPISPMQQDEEQLQEVLGRFT